jgi:hypothetical protein
VSDDLERRARETAAREREFMQHASTQMLAFQVNRAIAERAELRWAWTLEQCRDETLAKDPGADVSDLDAGIRRLLESKLSR